MRKPAVGIIFLTVFIDLIGFGIVIPLLQLYGKAFGASAWELALLQYVFSLMQFLFGPLLGRLSDRIGRRPVLLLSTAGSAISYAIFAYGSGLQGQTALWVLIGSRAFAGVCGANIGVAQAYIADITPPADRSRKMGLIGMAFGLGFIFGPPLGAFARSWLGVGGPGWLAGSVCAANFALALFILPESLKPSSEHAAQRPHLEQWAHTMTRPKVGLLIYIFFLATFCFACFENTIGLLICQKFDLDAASVRAVKLQGLLFAFAGVIGALVQGGAIGRLVKAFGEPRLIAGSLLLVAISLCLFPYIGATWAPLLVVLAVLSIGSSLTRPPVFGMISNLTNSREQGVTIGVAQGMGSLARILGPMILVPIFYRQPPVPYLICGGLSFVTGILAAWRLAGAAPHPQPAPVAEEVAS